MAGVSVLRHARMAKQ